MADKTLENLREAIVRNTAAILSLPSAGMLRNHKSRFLGESEGGFWVESIRGDGLLIEELISQHTAIGISFRIGDKRFMFATPIWKRDREYRVNAGVRADALLLAFPESLQAVQRRANYRVAIPDGCELAIKVWCITEEADLKVRPLLHNQIQGRIRDLSVGGMAMLCPPIAAEPAPAPPASETPPPAAAALASPEDPAVSGASSEKVAPKKVEMKPLEFPPDQRLRIELSYQDGEPLLMEGKIKHSRTNQDNSVRLGIQFKTLELNLEGRQTLSRLTTIVGDLHRAEVRRMRLGFSMAG